MTADNRVRTMADLDRFSQALSEAGAASRRLAGMCIAANATLLANLHLPAAPAFGLAAGIAAMTEFEEHVTRFEEAAVRLLGEARRPDEAGADYLSRVGGLIDGSVAGLVRAMSRNGLRLAI